MLRTRFKPGEEDVVHSAGPLMLVHELQAHTYIVGTEHGEHTRCQPRVTAGVLIAGGALLVNAAV